MNLKLIGPALAITAALAHAQTKPEFEVASVKPTPPDTKDGGYRFEPGGRFIVTNFTLKNLVQIGWHLQAYRIAGGPSWFDSERYNIEAKSDGNPTEGATRIVLQSLLADRFHLALHRETRELPIYSLVQVKSGAKLVASKEGGCTITGDFAGPPPPLAPGAPPGCGFTQRYRPQDNRGPVMQLQGLGAPLSQLARVLGNELEREVIDDTGIGGAYDMRIDYAPDDSLLARLTPGAKPWDNTAPSLFTALQEQLGLRLESRKGPVEVFVIDHAEKPSEN